MSFSGECLSKRDNYETTSCVSVTARFIKMVAVRGNVFKSNVVDTLKRGISSRSALFDK